MNDNLGDQFATFLAAACQAMLPVNSGCRVIARQWQSYSSQIVRLEADGRTFAEVSEQRRPADHTEQEKAA